MAKEVISDTVKEQKPKSEKERDKESLELIEKAIKRARFDRHAAIDFEHDTDINPDEVEMDFNPTAKVFDLKVKPESLKRVLTQLKDRYKNNLGLDWGQLKQNLDLYDRYKIGNPEIVLNTMLTVYRQEIGYKKIYGWPEEILRELKKYNYFPIEDKKYELREVGRDYVSSLLENARKGPHGQDSTDFAWENREEEYKKKKKKEALLAFEFFVEKGILNAEEDEDLFEKVTEN